MHRPTLRIWLCLLACLFVRLLPAAEGEKPKATSQKPLALGGKAVDFSLPGVDGKKYSLKSFASAKVLVVIFTCNHCPTAQAYEKRIIKLVTDYRKKGVGFVAISSNDPKAVRLDELGYTDLGDSFEDMKIRAKAAKFNFPYLYDGETQRTSRAYGPKATPQVMIFDSSRRLRYSGRIDNSESGKNIKSRDARNAIEALLAGKPVPMEKTRVFGCSIKWADKRKANERFMKKLAAEPVTLGNIDKKGVEKLRKNDSKKLRMVNVWATWCGPCRIEFPDLVTTNRMYRHRNFEFISISVDKMSKKETEVLPFLKKMQASNKNTIYGSSDLDTLAEVLDEKWSGSLPLTILIEPGGKISYRHEGAVDPLEVRRAIVKYIGRTFE